MDQVCSYLSNIIARLFACLLLFSYLPAKAATPQDSILILKQKLDSLSDDTNKVKILESISRKLNRIGDLEALDYALQTFELSKKIGYKRGQSISANTIGKIYLEEGNYQQALFYFLIALRITEQSHNWIGYSHSCNNIGSVYFNLNFLDKAYFYFNKSMNIKKLIGREDETGPNLNNLGHICLKRKELDQSIYYFNEGLEKATAVDDYYTVSVSLINLAEAYRLRKDFPKALDFCNQNIQMGLESNRVYNLTTAYATKGQIFSELNIYDSAEYNFKRAIEFAHKSGMKEQESLFNLELSTLYSKLGHTAEAFEYYKKYKEQSDSVLNEKTLKQISFLQVVHETEKKDAKIRSLHKDKEIYEAKAAKERAIYYAMITISALIVVLLIIFARNIVLKQRRILSEEKTLVEMQKQLVEQANVKLQHENTEAKYEVLKSKINPHFLFNGFSTLSSVVSKGEKHTQEFIEHFSDLFRMVLETTDLDLLSLEAELKTASSYLYLQKIEYGENLAFHIDIPLNFRHYLIPPFALQMVVENAIKHNVISEKRKLFISIKMLNDTIIITNNLQRKRIKPASTGTGQKNITERYKLLSVVEPEFSENEIEYRVSLPLIKKGILIET